MANTKVTGDLIASSTIATGNIADNAVTSDKISGITTAHITEGSNLYYTDARADARITAATTSDLTEGTNLYYTDARADARAALLVDSAPSTLNTLNELAAALGDDPNFATTVTNSIATKLPLAGGTLTGNLNAKNILFATSALPAANNPGINLRDTNNEFYFQSGSAHIFNFIRYDNRNSMMNLESTGINVTGGGTFSGNVTLTSATSDVDLIINSGADGVNDANREEGFIRFYQNNANFFSLGKRNNGQFVLLDHTAGQDVITVQDNGAILFNPANNMMGINPVSFRAYWSGYSVFKFGADNSIFSNSASGSGSAMFIGQNVYNDGANYRYNGAASNEASLFDMRSGTLAYLNAPNGSGGAVATMTNRFNVFLNGNFNIGVKETGAESVTGPFVVTHTSSRFLTSSYEESSVSLSAKNNNNNLETLRLAGDSIKFFNGTNAVGSQKMVILNNGNVGIGTTSPDYLLDLSKTAVAVDTYSGINLQASNYGYTIEGGLTQNVGGELIFSSNNAGTRNPRVKFAANGNVGIGETSPAEALQIGQGKSMMIGDSFFLGSGDTNYLGSMGFNRDTTNGNIFNSSYGAYQIHNYQGALKLQVYSSAGGTIGEHKFYNDGTVSFFKDVGIGVTSPKGKLDVFRAAGQSGTCAIAITNGESNNRSWGISTEVRKAGDFAILCSPSTNTTPVPTDDNIRFYLQSGGDISIAMQDYNANPSATNYGLQFETGATGKSYWQSAVNAATSHYHYEFINTNGSVGTIRTLNSATSYVTTSDYRLKEDLQNFEGLEMVSRIPVYDFKWKIDDTRSYGVMAHELQEVLPDGVSGEKDAEEMQGVDYSKIVPLLIKAIQELKTDNDSLKARIETLEN